jgi:MFS transporter, PCFT/HCP family, solute carrier family 46 (folate transporter), member 1
LNTPLERICSIGNFSRYQRVIGSISCQLPDKLEDYLVSATVKALKLKKMDEEKSANSEENFVNDVQGSRKSVRWTYGLEPAVFSLYFAFNLTNVILQNQILKQTCLMLGYNLTICEHLNTDNVTKAVELEVQPSVANINSSILLLNSIIPALLSLLLGAWTDKFGRKKLLMTSFTGYTLTLGLITLFSFISDNLAPLSPWYYFFSEMPMCFMGGWPALDIAVCCYVTDLSDRNNRSFRLGTITFLNFLSNITASYCSSYILEATSASIVFMISFSIAASAFIYTFIFVDESIHVIENATLMNHINAIFAFGRVKEIFVTLRRDRLHKERRMVWSLMTIVTMTVFTMHGNGTVNYLFVRERFDWALREWTFFESTNNLISLGGLFVGLMFLKKVLQISDMKIGLLALISSVVDSTVRAFAKEPYQMYLGSAFGLFRALVTPVFRSIMSNIIPHSEIGKIYSATTALEALSGLGAGPLYSGIYKLTLTSFPGAFLLITSAVFVLNLVLSLAFFRWEKLWRKNIIS